MRLLLLALLVSVAAAYAPAVGVAGTLGAPSVEHVHATADGVEPRADRVVGSSRSDVYHRPSCQHARRIRPANLVSFRSAAEARRSGYRACRVCRP